MRLPNDDGLLQVHDRIEPGGHNPLEGKCRATPRLHLDGELVIFVEERTGRENAVASIDIGGRIFCNTVIVGRVGDTGEPLEQPYGDLGLLSLFEQKIVGGLTEELDGPRNVRPVLVLVDIRDDRLVLSPAGDIGVGAGAVGRVGGSQVDRCTGDCVREDELQLVDCVVTGCRARASFRTRS